MYYVYVLFSSKHQRMYIGLTKNPDIRIKEHNMGRTRSTKSYRPWTLFYFERFDNRPAARKIEKKLKSGAGREHLKNMLELRP